MWNQIPLNFTSFIIGIKSEIWHCITNITHKAALISITVQIFIILKYSELTGTTLHSTSQLSPLGLFT